MPDRDETGLSLASVEQAVRKLGLRDFRQGDALFARQWAEVRADEANWDLCETKPDFLSEADDDAVAQAMTDRNFARAPVLPGRCVETGAAARQAAAGFAHSMSGRLAARFHDMAAALDAIRALLAGCCRALRHRGRPQHRPGRGFAAVDSARGRLYHRVKLDGGGRIVDYAIVAPTEWNFHPDGPFVRRLIGARIGAGTAAARRRSSGWLSSSIPVSASAPKSGKMCMHEMSLTEGVVEIFREEARKQGFSRVKTVWLEIGALSAVDPSAMEFCFDAATRGTLAEGARLEIICTPGHGWCLDCEKTVPLEERFGACPECGRSHVQMTGGDEMRVRELEVE